MTTYICYSKIGPKRLGGKKKGKVKHGKCKIKRDALCNDYKNRGLKKMQILHLRLSR